MISISEAIQIVISQIAQLPAQEIAIDLSHGRILAEDIVADTDLLTDRLWVQVQPFFGQ